LRPGGILTVADDLLKADGQKFLEMMEQLAERRMQREEEAALSVEEDDSEDDEDGEDDEDDEDEDDEDDDDEDDVGLLSVCFASVVEPELTCYSLFFADLGRG
jgi:hypothetical protein